MANRARPAGYLRNRKTVAIAFVIAAAVAVFFAVRTIVFLTHWSDPRHMDQPLEPWMTLGYVAKSYDVPRDALAQALEVEFMRDRRPTLEKLAAEKGVPLEDFERDVLAQIDTLRTAIPRE